jgi:hypothetical protein
MTGRRKRSDFTFIHRGSITVPLTSLVHPRQLLAITKQSMSRFSMLCKLCGRFLGDALASVLVTILFVLAQQ